MNKRFLGKTGVEITELGYGCTAQFGKDFLGKQCISFDKAYSLVETALNSGIRILDQSYMATASEKAGLVSNDDWVRFLYEKNLPQDTAFDWDGLIIYNDSKKGIGSNIGTVNL